MYRVLIVDDETTIREQLPVAFEWAQYGFEVAGTAANGMAAMEAVRKYSPDLILLDIRMPVMDGLSFLKWLHDSPFREPKVLIRTGYSEFDYARTAMRYGAAGYLNKPLDEDEIAEFLAEIAGELSEKNPPEEPEPVPDMTIRQYLMSVRIERAKELLERTTLHVYEIAHRVGFAESKYLVACFQKETGLSPAAWRREKTGKDVRD